MPTLLNPTPRRRCSNSCPFVGLWELTWFADNQWFGLKVRRAVVQQRDNIFQYKRTKRASACLIFPLSKNSRYFDSDVKASIYPDNEQDEQKEEDDEQDDEDHA